jgi:hypothetical protein
MSPISDSNRRPSPYEGDALTTLLKRHQHKIDKKINNN